MGITMNGNMRAFGCRVSAKRIALGLSQEKLAEFCDLSVNAIGKLESGQSDVKASTLKKLCDALGCSSDYLLYGSELPEGSTCAEQLLSLFREAQGKLDEKKMKLLLQQTQGLLCGLASL